MAAAPPDVAAPKADGQEMVFMVEVLGVSGLLKPELTRVQLTGFGMDGIFSSMPLESESTDPSGWLFRPDGTSGSEPPPDEPAAKAKGKAKAAPDKKTPPTTANGDGEERPASPPSREARLTHPCATMEQRQRLLDNLCGSMLHVDLVRQSDPSKPLGRTSLSLKDLIHMVSTVEEEQDLEWSPEFLEEWRQGMQEAADAEAAAAAEEAAAAREADGTASPTAEGAEPPVVPEIPQRPPSDPPKIRVRISTAGPIGRVLCPEDLEDWTVLTVQIDGCYGLPQGLLLPSPLPEGREGLLEEHPLSHSIRVLGCDFNGGQLVLPPLPEEPPPDADAGADAAAAADDGGDAAESEARGGSSSTPAAFVASIGKEEFVEGLVRTGLVAAQAVGPLLFDFLDVTGSGVIGPDEFARLGDMPNPVEQSKLLALRNFLIEKHQNLDEAFTALDANAGGALSLQDWQAGLESYECEAEDKDALFTALLDSSSQEVAREHLQVLGLRQKMVELVTVEKVAIWLLELVGSTEALWMQVDETKSGTATLESWQAALTRLGYQVTEDIDVVFNFVDSQREGNISRMDIEVLNKLGSPLQGGLAPCLVTFQALLSDKAQSDSPAEIFAWFCQDVGSDTLSPAEFVTCCQRLDLSSLAADPLVIFALLDVSQSGKVSTQEFEILDVYTAVSRRNRLSECKAFIVDSFGDIESGFRSLFEDRSEQCKLAEEKSAWIQFPKSSVTCYRGRAWLQKLFNTTSDSRGRNLVDKNESASGGTWLHYFPTSKGKAEPVDYKEVADPAQSGPARIARWHHGQGFVDLRRLAADAESEQGMPFQAFLSQVSAQPRELQEDGELPKAPFGASRMYIKGTIKLGEQPRRLCPRPEEFESLPEGWIPAPPEQAPPPTASEELELESHRIVTKLAGEFARMCREQGLEEPSIAANGRDEISLLGTKAEKGLFLAWLSRQEGGVITRDISTELTRSIVRLIRADHPDAPACGLTGNEKDAAYTNLHTLFLKHCVRALNDDVDKQQSRWDARLWRNCSLSGPKPGESKKAPTIDDGKAKLAGPQDDATLQRLIFEYELCGNWDRATELFQDRLKLPANAERCDAWYDYARFLMRTGQRQVDAESALRFAMSLRPSDTGPSLKETIFLACIMQNTDLPSSFDDEGMHHMRFDAACQLVAKYADRHPSKRTPLFFLFILHAYEAEGCKARAGQATSDVQQESEMQRHEQMAALASKYLELARAPQKTFNGTLAPLGLDGQPSFADLEGLVQRERFERKELEVVPEARPEQPAAWNPERFPAMPSFESVHAQEDPEDEAALGCIDLMLHFGLPGLVPFAAIEASRIYGFLSPVTVASERVQLQLVKAIMLQERWLLSDAIDLLEKILGRSDRLRSAHLLLGECRYRAAGEMKSQGASDALEIFADAQQSFETALAFLPSPDSSAAAGEAGDNVVHFRLASIHFAYAEAASFNDADTLTKAMQHYKRSLIMTPTAEVWLRAGICAYRQACLGRQRSLFRCKEPAPEYQSSEQELVQSRQAAFKEASKYLTEANLLDVTRPQINAWLVICAVETGNVQVAKQTLKQVLRYDSRLDAATCLELAVVLLRNSDESRAGPGEKKWLVQDVRYAAEAILVANVLTALRDCGEVHYILGLAHVLCGNDAAALPEFQAAVPWFNHDTPCQDEINRCIRFCSKRLNANADNAVGPVTVAPAPPRIAAQETEFRQRLEVVREGGGENRVADFVNWDSGLEVYDHDLPEILEAVAEGQVLVLSLRGARLGAWGVREIVARIRESPGCLQKVDVANCAAVGALGKELVSIYPFKRGVSMEAAGTGLPDDDVVRLRNRAEESEKTLRRAAAEQARSARLAEEYLSRQEILSRLGMEESNDDPAPTAPMPPYYPSRWFDGLALRAQQAYRDFLIANPMWGVTGPGYSDVTSLSTTITAKTGETIDFADADVHTVLQQKRVEMLKAEGYVAEEERGEEFDEGEEMPEGEEPSPRERKSSSLAVTRVPPPLYAAIFGPDDGSDLDKGNSVLYSHRLIGFMVYLGVRATPDEVAVVQEEREEMEAEEAQRIERLRRMEEERLAQEAKERAEWEALHKERVEARNNLTKKARKEYDGDRQLPKGVTSGQIMAHFTYLCLQMEAKLTSPLQLPSYFGLKVLSTAPRPKPRRGYDLHEALFTGKVLIEEACGRSFGKGALSLTLRSQASESIEVAVRRGTIFQHTDWVHKQNLMVGIDYLVTLPAGGVELKVMMAYCMNSSCSCSSGETMELTEFYVDASHVLDSQGNVWDHFQGCFNGS